MEIESKSNCPFCDFADRDVLIHEDEFVFAVISLRPINNYHVLVIPREHYEAFTDLCPTVWHRTFSCWLNAFRPPSGVFALLMRSRISRMMTLPEPVTIWWRIINFTLFRDLGMIRS